MVGVITATDIIRNFKIYMWWPQKKILAVDKISICCHCTSMLFQLHFGGGGGGANSCVAISNYCAEFCHSELR